MEAFPTVEEFESRGWYLSKEGIEYIASENEGLKSLNDYIEAAKDMDLSLLTTQGFNKTNEKLKEIPSPLVLQVVEVRNIAVPSISQNDNPRLLQVTLTDGAKKKWKAIEIHERVDCLRLQTPPGTKLLVTKPIPVQDQILLLEPGMLKELGGHVQELVQAWRAGKQFLKRNRETQNEQNKALGPPPFVPFKIKASDKSRNPSIAYISPQSSHSEKPKENSLSEPTKKKEPRTRKGKEGDGLLDKKEQGTDAKNTRRNKKGKAKENERLPDSQEKEDDQKKKEREKRKKKVVDQPKGEDRMEEQDGKIEKTGNKKTAKRRTQVGESGKVKDEDTHETGQEEALKHQKSKRDEQKKRLDEVNLDAESAKREKPKRREKKKMADETTHDLETTKQEKPQGEERKKKTPKKQDALGPKEKSLVADDVKEGERKEKKKSKKEDRLEEKKSEVVDQPDEKRTRKKQRETNGKKSKAEKEEKIEAEERSESRKKKSDLSVKESEQTEDKKPRRPAGSNSAKKERKGSTNPEKSQKDEGMNQPRLSKSANEKRSKKTTRDRTIDNPLVPQQQSKAKNSASPKDANYQSSKAYDHQQQLQQAYDYPYQGYSVPQPSAATQNGYYYQPQQAYSMADYSVMVPVYPNAGMPQGAYGYPSTDPQQQQYMQPVYYQQPYYGNNSYQPYYNHHNYYDTSSNKDNITEK